MKHLKRLLVVAAAVVMAMAMAVPAFAQTQNVGTGNGSITVSNAEIGKTYEIYQLFDATVSDAGDIAYSLPTGKTLAAPATTWFVVENGNVKATDAFTAAVAGSEEFKTWAESFGTKVGDTITAEDSSVKFDQIPYGYYFVKTNTGAALTVDSANPDATVIDKNQTVTTDKNIVDDPDNPVKVNEAGLDEGINFQIDVDAKQYDGTDKIFKYMIYDTMDPGFSLTGAPVVKVGGSQLDPGAYTISYKKGEAATETVTEADYFEIAIPWTNDGTKAGDFLYDANADIVVTYTAKLDPAKAANVSTGNTPNKNIADVKYFKGNDNPDENEPSGDTPDVKTDTYDTQLTIHKTDGKDPMTGAEFTLTSTNGTKVVYTTGTEYVADENGTYYKLKDGTYTDEAPNGQSGHDAAYESKTQKYKLQSIAVVKGEGQADATVKAFVKEDGTLTFTGLGVGSYKIEETVVPAGYNKAADVEFTISFDASTKEFSSNNTSLTETNNVFDTTVVNNKGTELPSTGGIGTTILYAVGVILVIGAGVYLVTKRRARRDSEIEMIEE